MEVIIAVEEPGLAMTPKYHGAVKAKKDVDINTSENAIMEDATEILLLSPLCR
jgi:hypothetical protein